MKILAISLDTYGDQVLRQPLLTALLDEGHEVTLAIRRDYADIVPFLDPRLKALVCDLAPHPIGADPAVSLADNRALVEKMKSLGADAVVALPFNRTSLDNAILMACTGAARFALTAKPSPSSSPSPSRSGTPAPRPADIDALAAAIEHPVPVTETSREGSKNLELYKAITGKASGLRRPRIQVSAKIAGDANRLVKSLGIERAGYVVMGGLRPLTMKTMPTDLAVQTIAWLESEHQLRTVLAGVEAERELLEHIRLLAVEQGATPVVYVGQTGKVGELLALLSASSAYVGADAGPMHFAAALGRPVAALFGGGHFPRFEPDAKHWFATTKRLLCFGCGWRCIYDTPRCIREVETATWLRGIAKLLAGGSPGWVFEAGSVDEVQSTAVRDEFQMIAGRYWRAIQEARESSHDASHAQASEQMLRATVDRLSNELGVVERDRVLRKDHIDTLTRRIAKLEASAATVESDRAARLEVINKLNAESQAFELAARQRLALLETSQADLTRVKEELAAVNADRAARGEVIERLSREKAKLETNVAEFESDRAARGEVIERLSREKAKLEANVAEFESDRAARGEVIERLSREKAKLEANVAEFESDRAARGEVIERLSREKAKLEANVVEIESDRAARLEVIHNLNAEKQQLESAGGALRALQQAIRRAFSRRR